MGCVRFGSSAKLYDAAAASGSRVAARRTSGRRKMQHKERLAMDTNYQESVTRRVNRRRMMKWLSAMAIALLMLPGLNAWGQFESATVLGYVRDASGAAVPNANVTLTN